MRCHIILAAFDTDDNETVIREGFIATGKTIAQTFPNAIVQYKRCDVDIDTLMVSLSQAGELSKQKRHPR